ncbi:MAG: DUF4160 domain-containing protein [Sulfurisoma sp.]|nr:DUF4160 domain-containing protein [Sulfurisoma sp.]
MPTIFWIGPYRFFFYAGDRGEPVHVHVERDSMVAKFWLSPVRLHHSKGFGRPELNRIRGLIEENRQRIEEEWYAYFGN